MEMKSIKNQYPVYIPDQFLTSDNLNESFGFLECHERVTRGMIIGEGIINGLDYSYTTAGSKVKTVNISSGYGSSKDGYFIYLPEESPSDKILNYKYYMNWLVPAKIFDPLATDEKTIGSFRLLTEDDLKDPVLKEVAKPIDIPESDLTGKFILALFADIRVTKPGNCSPGNCNTKGEEDRICPIALLIDKSSFSKINPLFIALHGLMLYGLNGISSIVNKADYVSRITDIATKNLGLVSEKLEEVAEASLELIATESKTLKNSVKVLKGIIAKIGTKPDFCEYYLLFAADLQLAINEYVTHYNNFIEKYYTTDAGHRFNRMLVLGRFPFQSSDPYRYLWTSPLSSRDRRANYFILAGLCKRISVLINHFTEAKILDLLLAEHYGTKAETRLKLIPDKGYASKLGDRSVPYYYDVVNNGAEIFNKFWRTQDLDNRTELVFNYFDDINTPRKKFAEPYEFNLAGFPFYRIEGHIGLETKDALAKLQSLIVKLDIPVQVIKVEIENQRWSGFKDKYYDFIAKYDLFYKDLIAIRYNENPEKQAEHDGFIRKFKEIRKSINEISYRDIDTVKAMINDVNAYGRMFSGAVRSAAKKAKTAGAGNNAGIKAATAASKAVYTGDVASAINKRLTERNIFQLREDLLKDYPVMTPDTGYSIRELKGCEYLGGVFKGGTIILVSDGTRIIGDFSLPYFVEKK